MNKTLFSQVFFVFLGISMAAASELNSGSDWREWKDSTTIEKLRWAQHAAEVAENKDLAASILVCIDEVYDESGTAEDRQDAQIARTQTLAMVTTVCAMLSKALAESATKYLKPHGTLGAWLSASADQREQFVSAVAGAVKERDLEWSTEAVMVCMDGLISLNLTDEERAKAEKKSINLGWVAERCVEEIRARVSD